MACTSRGSSREEKVFIYGPTDHYPDGRVTPGNKIVCRGQVVIWRNFSKAPATLTLPDAVFDNVRLAVGPGQHAVARVRPEAPEGVHRYEVQLKDCKELARGGSDPVIIVDGS